MKRFLIKLFVFTLPILCWFIIEGFLPSSIYTWRPWEALRFQSGFAMGDYFHPNEELQMESVGELCHHTPYAIPQVVTWKTDKLGNRNDVYISDPDILIMGDSHVAGGCISQDSTITNLLISALNNQSKVYNIAPTDLSLLDYYLKEKLIDKPKLLIFIKSEKYIPQALIKYSNQGSIKTKVKTAIKSNTISSRLRIFLDKTFRSYSKNWVQARFSNQKGDGIPGKPGSNMFFRNPATQPYDPNLVYSPTDYKKTAERIITYKNYCDSLGIRFMFVPIANKSTVYFDYVPLEQQPTFMFKLDSMMRLNNVKTINTLELFNDYRKSHTSLLFHRDDTHWNPNGIQLVSKEIAKIIVSDYSDLLNEKHKSNDLELARTIK